MSPPQRPPDLNSPHASRGEKVKNAKGSFSDVSGGKGYGEIPNSRLKKFGIGFAIFLILLFIFMDLIDRGNAKKRNFHYEPTADVIAVMKA
jgi:hypothetical protein